MASLQAGGKLLLDPWGTLYKRIDQEGATPRSSIESAAGSMKTGYYLPNFYRLSEEERVDEHHSREKRFGSPDRARHALVHGRLGRAFSAYMRVARLPSSYSRPCTSASRQLVKAAVARAIDSADRAIANNPHPGIGRDSIGGGNRNVWTHRIFTATNALLEADETVPVLTLEALAYIPPPLVNAARY